MNLLYFDIETVPAAPEHHGLLREEYESRKAKGRKVEDTFEEYLDRTGLGGEFGRVVCLAYALNEQPVEVIWGEEREILEGFWRVAGAIDRRADRFIGHNIYDFDFPFLVKRSRILGVPPGSGGLPNFARYRQTPIYDTMREWDLWSNRQVSMDFLAKALGLPTSKDLMDGSEVASYYAAGRIEEICEYCKKDVELTRQIYKKLTWQFDASPR